MTKRENLSNTLMIQIRDIEMDDIRVIGAWPSYPTEFAALDYALRENGWLSQYLTIPETRCFAIERSGQVMAFTILSKTGPGEAEFRIAIRADLIGTGLGGDVAIMTFEMGFFEMGLERIHLIVRKNNPRAARLYRRLGFVDQGEISKIVNGKQTDFFIMDLHKNTYSPE
ncbi:MAG: GNAT family N-acetyltransferase [Proteobacteria bacterium]|nr:GNAT family N-acetyltransferase [Pseudomonadota bacterium]